MKRTLITTAIALLAIPATASATTYTVSPGQSIGAAVNGANDNDTVHVLPGVYVEQPITVAHAVTIEGEPGTTVTNASTDPSQALFTFTTKTSGSALSKLTAASTAGPVVIAQDANLAVSDALLLSVAGDGPALRLAGPGASSLVRSSVAAIAPGADAVQMQSTTTGNRSLTIDSSVLSGGANAASLDVTSSNSLLTPNTGNIVVSAVHATIAGAAAAVATKVTPFVLGTPGTIAVTARRSILRGTLPDGVADGSDDVSNTNVFVNPAAKNFHLRADATSVIDKGGPQVDGESVTDIDGQPRVVGAASDLGADEFVNQAPVSRLAAPAATRTPGATTFDASASSDPEAGSGGGIANYHFDFGDGTAADSNTPTVTHTYARPGTYSATVTVTDAQGLAGAASGAVQAQVADGIAPTVRIISPRNNKKLKRRSSVRITGSAADDIAVAGVGLTLQRPGSKKLTKITAKLQQGIWSYKLPSKLKRKRGRYTVTAYAIDAAGNLSKAARVRFTLK